MNYTEGRNVRRAVGQLGLSPTSVRIVLRTYKCRNYMRGAYTAVIPTLQYRRCYEA